MRNQVFICSGCSGLIYEGAPVLHFLGEQLCSKCVQEFTERAVKADESDRDQLLQPGK